MAKITIKELYYGDKYAVMSEIFKKMFLASPNKAGVDEQTADLYCSRENEKER